MWWSPILRSRSSANRIPDRNIYDVSGCGSFIFKDILTWKKVFGRYLPSQVSSFSFFDDLHGDVLTLVLALGEVHGHPVGEIPVNLDDTGIIGHIDLTDRDVPDPCVADDEVSKGDLVVTVRLTEVDLEPGRNPRPS